MSPEAVILTIGHVNGVSVTAATIEVGTPLLLRATAHSSDGAFAGPVQVTWWIELFGHTFEPDILTLSMVTIQKILSAHKRLSIRSVDFSYRNLFSVLEIGHLLFIV